MPLGAYTADPRNAAQPLDTVSGGFAAREIRALKQLVLDLEFATPQDTAGAGNAYTDPSLPTALTTGSVYITRANRANTGAATLTPGAGSAVTIKKFDNSTDLVANEILANQVLWLYKTGTNLILLNPSPVAASTALAGIVQLVNDLVTNDTAKALTAAQGVAIKALIDADTAALNTHKSSSDHDGRYYTETEVDAALATKAAVNGDNTTRFDVASPNDDDQAIRRDTYAASTTGGTIKMRYDAPSETLYIRNDGTDA